MFNEDQKTAFIQSYTSKKETIQSFVKMFNSAEEYEERFQKDLSQFTNSEMSAFFTEKSGLRNTSKVSMSSRINRYLSWAKNNGINVVCDRIQCDDDDTVEKFRNKMVFNPDHLNRYMDVVFGDISERTNGLLCRCYLWLAFCNVDIADAERLRDSDVDINLMRVLVHGREVPLYEQAVPAFAELKNLDELRVFNPLYPDKVIMKQREDGDRFLRGAKVAGISRVEIQDGERGNTSGEVKRKTKKAIDAGLVSARINFTTVKLSGIFYRMYIREEMGIKVDFSVITSMEMAGKSFSSNRVFNAAKHRIKSGYERDYDLWKRAYMLYKEDSLL